MASVLHHSTHVSRARSAWRVKQRPGQTRRQTGHQAADCGLTNDDVLRALANWTGAIAGLLLILVGGLIQAAVTVPDLEGHWSVMVLPITLQVPALLLTALVCGQRSAILAAVGYLTLGLFQLPVFHGGGGPAYLLDPGFGYLAGFVPAGWVTGKLARQRGMNSLLHLTLASLIGLGVIQICGVLNLLLGAVAGRWEEGLLTMLISYSLVPLVSQLILCCAVAVVAFGMRKLLLIPS